MPQLLLFGYFGAGNFGDEWMLASFLKGCKKLGLDPSDFVVLSRTPQRTSSEHNVPAIPRNWRAILSSVQKCQAVIGCGGSLLQDVTSFRSLAFYCLLIWTAKKMGKKVAMLGQGLGPLKRILSRKLVKQALNSCDLVTFRERASFDTARQLGVCADNCLVTADLTFAWDELPQRERKAEVGVNLRPVKEQWNSEAIAKGIKSVLGEGERVLLLPLQTNVDEFALKPLANSLRVEWWRYENWFDGLKGIAGVGLLVAMRLHALIAACLLAVPFVALNYDPKVANILRGIAAEQILPLSAIDDELADAIRKIRNEFVLGLERLREFAANQRLEAKGNFELMARKVLG